MALAITTGMYYYPVIAVNFDGTNDYLVRGAGMSGAAASKLFTLSFWLKAGVDGTLMNIFTDGAVGSTRFWAERNTSNGITIHGQDAGGEILTVSSSAGSAAIASGWIHVLCSCDMAGATAKRWLYINDVSDATWTLFTDGIIVFTASNWSVGALSGGTVKLTGDVAEIWFEDGLYTDFSVTANRRKFISATGKPVDLGSTGEIPTGTSPLVFQSGAVASWHTNKGTGGGFTLNGALTASTTKPSDLGIWYPAIAVNFDGSADYLTRGATLTGAADSKLFTLSFWAKKNANDSVAQRIFAGVTALNGATYRFVVACSSINTVIVVAQNAAGTAILDCNCGTTVAGSGWKHYLISIDLGAAVKNFYLNDVQSYTQTTFTNDTIDFTILDWSIGAYASGIDKASFDIADLWFLPGTAIDFSVVANRRLFISATGKPVDLGLTGEIPTGTSPLVFQSGAVASWHTNKGTGGGFTLNGALTASSTSPSN